MTYLNDSVLNFPPEQVKRFLFNDSSYFNGDLPKYFTFENMFYEIDTIIRDKKLSDFIDEVNKPANYDNINHHFITNKDGKYGWRPLQLIHPVMYVNLINILTEKTNWLFLCGRFKEFQSNEHIKCMSIPVISTDDKVKQKSKQIKTWIENIESESVKQSLNYEYLFLTDITDCYPSIYTHTISWALHSKSVAKNNKTDKSLLGNRLDYYLQIMSNGQTNGIPQGSILMDFIAEIVLGYADLELSKKIGKTIENYQIIRYRDDYRIFTENQTDGEKILILLTEVLLDLGLKINSNKTKMAKNPIIESFKPGKLDISILNNKDNDKKKHLLKIYLLAEKHPQSGTIQTLLTGYYKSLNINPVRDDIEFLLSIVIDLSIKNPRLYPLAASIISKIFDKIDNIETKNIYLDKIIKKYSKNPNTGYINIWLQRISYSFNPQKQYDEKLCQILIDSTTDLWNSEWLKPSLKAIIQSEKIIDREYIKSMKPFITNEEINAFIVGYDNPILIEPE